jgi:biopolymer transport protein ExbD
MDEKEFDYMNVIPFVDIMLVLLTIVLMTSPFIATGVMPVDLPKASMNKPGALKSEIIELNRDGKIYLNSSPATLPELKASLNGFPRTANILIRADKNAALQEFVTILDMVKMLGFHLVHLQTEIDRS